MHLAFVFTLTTAVVFAIGNEIPQKDQIFERREIIIDNGDVTVNGKVLDKGFYSSEDLEALGEPSGPAIIGDKAKAATPAKANTSTTEKVFGGEKKKNLEDFGFDLNEKIELMGSDDPREASKNNSGDSDRVFASASGSASASINGFPGSANGDFKNATTAISVESKASNKNPSLSTQVFTGAANGGREIQWAGLGAIAATVMAFYC